MTISPSERASLDSVRDDMNARLAEIFADFAQANNAREERDAKADPVKHKLTKVFANTSYRYFRGGKDGRGREVRFCYSCHRNVAGYFLAWREVWGKGEGKRDGFIANRRKATLVERQRKLAERARGPR